MTAAPHITLTARQGAVLQFLGGEDRATPDRLAAVLRCPRNTAAEVAGQLVKKGLVIRVPDSSGHMRYALAGKGVIDLTFRTDVIVTVDLDSREVTSVKVDDQGVVYDRLRSTRGATDPAELANEAIAVAVAENEEWPSWDLGL